MPYSVEAPLRWKAKHFFQKMQVSGWQHASSPFWFSFYIYTRFLLYCLNVFTAYIHFNWNHLLCHMNSSNYLCWQTAFQKPEEAINQCFLKYNKSAGVIQRERETKNRRRRKNWAQDASNANEPSLICLQMANDFPRLTDLSG